MSNESSRSGVMLVRVWVNDGELVARLQSRSGDADQNAKIAVGLTQILETVKQWLRDLAEMPQ